MVPGSKRRNPTRALPALRRSQMKKLSIALLAALAFGTSSANATSGSVSIDMNATTQVLGGTACIETFDLNWISSSVGCGLWGFYPAPGYPAKWFNDGASCPTPIPAQANLVETP